MIEKVRKLVYEILKNDNSGHGIDHIDRVLRLSLKFAEYEQCDVKIVILAALLHDVDDYKLFGKENAKELTNAKIILNFVGAGDDTSKKIITIIQTMGYSNYLKGIRPETIEGKIISDADMCDALGACGILRSYAYNIKKGRPFFDKDKWPMENITAENYDLPSSSSVCHMFEKILRLKGLMMTSCGRKEAIQRHQIIEDFLYQLFIEEDAMDWVDYLEKFNKKENERIEKILTNHKY